ncbi:hypothetical protein AX15_001062 [Amanita polypyramis BW_CC]|nr:hypothetical protein AX15_001062 [Amanita polypyramis BW_CC]
MDLWEENPLGTYPNPQKATIQPSGIIEFPTEILEHVFLLATMSSFSDPPLHCERNILSPAKVLSHVCKRWRRITVNYSLLWSFITRADFCNFYWMQVVLQLSGSYPLKINFHSTYSSWKELEMLYFITRPGRIKQFSLETDHTMPTLSTRSWPLNLENLRICMRAEDDRSLATDTETGDYVSHITAHHVPDLLFHTQPHELGALHYDMPRSLFKICEVTKLRHLSLINCYVIPDDLIFPNLQRLEISHVLPARQCSGSLMCEWEQFIRCLPRLKSLSIDGAMGWHSICDERIKQSTDVLPQGRLTDLQINRCSPGCATLLNILSPRSLQLTCTDVYDNEEFRPFCIGVQSWLKRWKTNVPNRYLFVSIQPDGIIVHNRSTRQEEDNEASPALQLVLYWKARSAGKGLDLIAPLLNLISTMEPHPSTDLYPTSSPLVLGCATLELSIGLFDYKNRAFRRVITQFLCRFRDVKKLRCIGGAAVALASLTPDKRPAEIEPSFPLLECVCFDHIDLEDELGEKLAALFRLWAHQNCSVNRIELNGCQYVSQSTVASLRHAGTEVVLDEGTILTDGSSKDKGTKMVWTSDQVKLLMKKWAGKSC